jgi:hypothetical protein
MNYPNGKSLSGQAQAVHVSYNNSGPGFNNKYQQAIQKSIKDHDYIT